MPEPCVYTVAVTRLSRACAFGASDSPSSALGANEEANKEAAAGAAAAGVGAGDAANV